MEDSEHMGMREVKSSQEVKERPRKVGTSIFVRTLAKTQSNKQSSHQGRCTAQPQ